MAYEFTDRSTIRRRLMNMEPVTRRAMKKERARMIQCECGATRILKDGKACSHENRIDEFDVARKEWERGR